MALYKALDIEKEGAIVVITLNRPEVGNAFDMNMGAELDHAVRQIGDDKETRALIITGAGKYFSTGIDLSMFTKSDRHPAVEPAKKEILPPDDDETPGKGTALAAAIRMRNMLKPAIAAVNGPAVGLGFSIALACDIIIASDRAKFSVAFVKRGVVPDTGGTFNLPRIVGMQKACELALTGDTSDNVPGIPGVGAKTAAKLLAQYGGLEAVLEHAGEIKGKLGERVREHGGATHLSKKLVTIECEVELDVGLEDLRPGEPHEDELRELFTRLEFGRFLKELAPQESLDRESYELVMLVQNIDGEVLREGVASYFRVQDEQPELRDTRYEDVVETRLLAEVQREMGIR